ncbi:hypothetical protein BpHYR1_013341 [Brachionus plicatilis]|uniref:Uncharacterized protein n=1 Tax=Brachionus plicatilis TaxID=10195 RepID=A0A3M7QCR9_BRAPC|nr:hypothetical protein BpHYR1_013341 [Brachionus plicatilis]
MVLAYKAFKRVVLRYYVLVAYQIATWKTEKKQIFLNPFLVAYQIATWKTEKKQIFLVTATISDLFKF